MCSASAAVAKQHLRQPRNSSKFNRSESAWKILYSLTVRAVNRRSCSYLFWRARGEAPADLGGQVVYVGVIITLRSTETADGLSTQASGITTDNVCARTDMLDGFP